MAWGTSAAFVAASLVLALIPGPGVATIVGFACGSGRRAALAAVAGGNALAFAASFAGAAAVLATSAHAFALLEWAGALYLMFPVCGRSGARGGAAVHGLARPPARAPPSPPRWRWAPSIRRRSCPSSPSPRSPISPAAACVPQTAILVATFTAVAATTDTGYALAAARAARLFARPARRPRLERAGGGVPIAAGLAVAAVRR